MQNAGQKVKKEDNLRGDRGEQFASVSDRYSGIDSVHSLYFLTDYPVGFMYIVTPSPFYLLVFLCSPPPGHYLCQHRPSQRKTNECGGGVAQNSGQDTRKDQTLPSLASRHRRRCGRSTHIGVGSHQEFFEREAEKPSAGAKEEGQMEDKLHGGKEEEARGGDKDLTEFPLGSRDREEKIHEDDGQVAGGLGDAAAGTGEERGGGDGEEGDDWDGGNCPLEKALTDPSPNHAEKTCQA